MADNRATHKPSVDPEIVYVIQTDPAQGTAHAAREPGAATVEAGVQLFQHTLDDMGTQARGFLPAGADPLLSGASGGLNAAASELEEHVGEDHPRVKVLKGAGLLGTFVSTGNGAYETAQLWAAGDTREAWVKGGETVGSLGGGTVGAWVGGALGSVFGPWGTIAGASFGGYFGSQFGAEAGADAVREATAPPPLPDDLTLEPTVEWAGNAYVLARVDGRYHWYEIGAGQHPAVVEPERIWQLTDAYAQERFLPEQYRMVQQKSAERLERGEDRIPRPSGRDDDPYNRYDPELDGVGRWDGTAETFNTADSDTVRAVQHAPLGEVETLPPGVAEALPFGGRRLTVPDGAGGRDTGEGRGRQVTERENAAIATTAVITVRIRKRKARSHPPRGRTVNRLQPPKQSKHGLREAT